MVTVATEEGVAEEGEGVATIEEEVEGTCVILLICNLHVTVFYVDILMFKFLLETIMVEEEEEGAEAIIKRGVV